MKLSACIEWLFADTETEKDIMDQVTIIAITHRLSVIAEDDHVVGVGR